MDKGRGEGVGSRESAAANHHADLRRLLVDDYKRTAGQIATLSQNFTSIVEAAQLTSTDDEHDPEGATIAFERSQTSALLTAARRRLAEVEAALAKIAEEEYGLCERCGEPIHHERLLARPAARTCIVCAGLASANP